MVAVVPSNHLGALRDAAGDVGHGLPALLFEQHPQSGHGAVGRTERHEHGVAVDAAVTGKGDGIGGCRFGDPDPARRPGQRIHRDDSVLENGTVGVMTLGAEEGERAQAPHDRDCGPVGEIDGDRFTRDRADQNGGTGTGDLDRVDLTPGGDQSALGGGDLQR